MATGDITSITVRADGWSADVVVSGFTTGATYDFGTPGSTSTSKLYLTITSEGYDATGTLGTMSRTVYATKVVRKAYPNNASLDETGGGNLTFRVALSQEVYNDDTIASATAVAGAIVNSGGAAQSSTTVVSSTVMSSTLDYPVAFGQWDGVAGVIMAERVKSDFVMAFNAFHGQGIACVKFTATGVTSSHVETATVTTQSATLRTATGLYANAYQSTITLSGFTQGETITLRAQVYPKVGDANSILDTTGRTTTTNECLGWNEPTIICDKSNLLDAIHYVSSTGNDSTGNGTSGNPWLTIAKAVSQASVNIVRLMGTATYALGSAATRKTTAEWIVVEADSGAVPKVQITATTAYKCQRLKISGLKVQLLSSSSFMDGEAANNFLWFENCIFDRNAITAPTTSFAYRSDCVYVMNCTGDLNRTDWSFAGFSTARVAVQLDGVQFASQGSANYVDCWFRIVACRGASISFTDKTAANVAPNQDGVIVAYNKFTKNALGASNWLYIGNATNLSNIAIVGNVCHKWESVGGGIVFFADNSLFTLSHAVIAHNTIQADRMNCCYNETGTTSYLKTCVFFRGNHASLWNIKTDTFGTQSGNRIGNWSVVYGLNFDNNNFDADSGTGAFLQEYAGLASSTSTPTFNNWGADDYRPALADTVLKSKVSAATYPAHSRYDLNGVELAATYDIGAEQYVASGGGLLVHPGMGGGARG